MKKAIKIPLVVLCVVAIVLTLVACGGTDNAVQRNVPVYDRDGFPITIPEEINTIISIGPANTEILVALGFADAIIQTDMFSYDVPGISPDIATYDMLSPDLEHIVSLAPDIIFVSGFTRTEGEEPLAQVANAGISVIHIPSAESIADIRDDIRFIAAILDAEPEGEALISEMDAEISRIQEIAEGITERRRVYFEVSPAPWMFTFGTGTFLHEMLEIAGAINVFAHYEGWTGLGDEVLLELNPDVILTSTDFIDDPIGEIKGRPGWSNLTAVQNGDVFFIDTNSSNRQSHNIVRALQEIATAVYPEKFQ